MAIGSDVRGPCVTLAVFAIGAFVVSTAVASGVPNTENVVSCNAEASDAILRGSAARGSAMPNTGDRSRAAAARENEPSSKATSRVARSLDAQLDGMDGEGAKDPAYQAAFRGCMRRMGF